MPSVSITSMGKPWAGTGVTVPGGVLTVALASHAAPTAAGGVAVAVLTMLAGGLLACTRAVMVSVMWLPAGMSRVTSTAPEPLGVGQAPVDSVHTQVWLAMPAATMFLAQYLA